MTAEIVKNIGSTHRWGAASMRPRPNDRGNSVLYNAYCTAPVASMRPRPNDRGNPVGG